MELLEMIQKDRINEDDLIARDRVVIDRDGCEFESMSQYLERFPNRHEFQGVTHFEWGSTPSGDDDHLLVVVNYEGGAWQIGVYPIDDPDTSVWRAEVVDEKSAVLTLHVLTEVL